MKDPFEKSTGAGGGTLVCAGPDTITASVSTPGSSPGPACKHNNSLQLYVVQAYRILGVVKFPNAKFFSNQIVLVLHMVNAEIC